jgi:hypothetical protein
MQLGSRNHEKCKHAKNPGQILPPEVVPTLVFAMSEINVDAYNDALWAIEADIEYNIGKSVEWEGRKGMALKRISWGLPA